MRAGSPGGHDDRVHQFWHFVEALSPDGGLLPGSFSSSCRAFRSGDFRLGARYQSRAALRYPGTADERALPLRATASLAACRCPSRASASARSGFVRVSSFWSPSRISVGWTHRGTQHELSRKHGSSRKMKKAEVIDDNLCCIKSKRTFKREKKAERKTSSC